MWSRSCFLRSKLLWQKHPHQFPSAWFAHTSPWNSHNILLPCSQDCPYTDPPLRGINPLPRAARKAATQAWKKWCVRIFFTCSVLFGLMLDPAVFHKRALVEGCFWHQLKCDVTVAYAWQPVIENCFTFKEICRRFKEKRRKGEKKRIMHQMFAFW